MQASLPEIQSSAECWQNINVHSLRIAMRSAYENRDAIVDNKPKIANSIKLKFSHESVGKLIKEVLNGLN